MVHQDQGFQRHSIFRNAATIGDIPNGQGAMSRLGRDLPKLITRGTEREFFLITIYRQAAILLKIVYAIVARMIGYPTAFGSLLIKAKEKRVLKQVLQFRLGSSRHNFFRIFDLLKTPTR